MFGEAAVTPSRHARTGLGQLVSEAVATFGLLAVIWACARRRPGAAPFAVGAYITAAYWFTASTSFANPAVTLARTPDRQLRRHSPRRRPGFRGRSARRRGGRHHPVPLAPPHRARRRPGGGGAPPGGDREHAMKTYVFACVHNAGRSQMAAAWLGRLADPAKARAVSAGTEPGARVHPEVVEAMREVGIDLSAAQPRKLTDDLARGATVLVTMGCGEACPAIPGLRREDWPLEDPKGKAARPGAGDPRRRARPDRGAHPARGAGVIALRRHVRR